MAVPAHHNQQLVSQQVARYNYQPYHFGQPGLSDSVGLLCLEEVQEVAAFTILHDDVEHVLAGIGAPHVGDVGHSVKMIGRRK